jgi:hypothetical protein
MDNVQKHNTSILGIFHRVPTEWVVYTMPLLVINGRTDMMEGICAFRKEPKSVINYRTVLFWTY